MTKQYLQNCLRLLSLLLSCFPQSQKSLSDQQIISWALWFSSDCCRRFGLEAHLVTTLHENPLSVGDIAIVRKTVGKAKDDLFLWDIFDIFYLLFPSKFVLDWLNFNTETFIDRSKTYQTMREKPSWFKFLHMQTTARERRTLKPMIRHWRPCPVSVANEWYGHRLSDRISHVSEL